VNGIPIAYNTINKLLEVNMRLLTIEQIKERCVSNGHIYVSGWTNSKSAFTVRCSCGNRYETWLTNIVKGHKCSVCSGGGGHTKEYIEQELSLLGITLVSPYIQSRKPFTFICRCGGIGHNSLHHVLAGQGCGNCAENKWREKFNERGCEIITYNKATDITFRCSCGAIHTVQANNWFTQGHGCPTCKVKYNYNPHRIDRKSTYTWKKRLLIRDNFMCRNCGYDNDLEAHHIEAYSQRPDLVDDIDNGIILCKVCHQSLHSIYGWNVGRKNLEIALYEEAKSK
jgi:hypothetical protein